jgi:cytochrome P450
MLSASLLRIESCKLACARVPELIPMFVEEVLRLEPAFRYHIWQVPIDTALNGVEIPAGTTVLLLRGAANREAAMFGHPESIDLTRRHHADMCNSVEASISVLGCWANF